METKDLTLSLALALDACRKEGKQSLTLETGVYTLTAEHSYDHATRTFKATVPEGCVFVMGDNRNNSKDGRDTDVGFIDERCILGKAILRLSPFTLY